MTKQEKKQHCIGCRNNFYNGNNDLGVKECWSFKTSQIVQRVEVPVHQRPPYHQTPRKSLSCYHADGYAYLKPDDVRVINGKSK